jgi:hypothetical protein
MLFHDTTNLKPSEFKRLTGVTRDIFNLMVNSVHDHISLRLTKRGNISTFSIQDQILIMLEYYREYRTFFHIASSYHVHESTISRIVSKIESILIKDTRFSLPSKKSLEQGDSGGIHIQAIIVDATEIPIQRPKKTNIKNSTTQVKRNDTR